MSDFEDKSTLLGNDEVFKHISEYCSVGVVIEVENECEIKSENESESEELL
jgi:hypothetical protein